MKLLNYLIFHVVHFINIEKQSPVDEKMLDHREFTLILYVNDIVGMLAQVLNTVSKLQLCSLYIKVYQWKKATITLSLSAKDTTISMMKL